MTTETIELPQELYARAEQTAKAKGIALADFVTEAVQARSEPDAYTQFLRMRAFGGLSDLHEENLRIMDLIEETFDPEMLEERKREAGA